MVHLRAAQGLVPEPPVPDGSEQVASVAELLDDEQLPVQKLMAVTLRAKDTNMLKARLHTSSCAPTWMRYGSDQGYESLTSGSPSGCISYVKDRTMLGWSSVALIAASLRAICTIIQGTGSDT